ncbi:MAG TPA: sugar transferase [Terriglobales bacterium]|jgi:lipopolysaccharide/colanic/teichoic acid biosynthesis glycosyltransferase|nr:sugar transferase [Terriglobales bacterium]
MFDDRRGVLLKNNPFGVLRKMCVQAEEMVSLEMSPFWHRWLFVTAKRALDIVLSAFFLFLLLPMFLVLAVMVKLTSPGPLFYTWRVVGKDGRRFNGYKFRSMCANADELKGQLEHLNEMDGPVFKLTQDPRVTKLGIWMRRHSLDELPQLYSVLKGDMSLVGPRPPLYSEYECFTEYQKRKVAVKPGITCLWQVNGRNDVRSFEQWVEMDLKYIREWSPLLDFRILCKTFIAVFAGTGK